MITVYINGMPVTVPKNSTVLQACRQLNIEIPVFCFHEMLPIAGNCRMCVVEIENSPKPVASCAMPVIPQMKIFTNSPLVQKARESVLEFLLIHHPLDCPICDQGSECDLQDQAFLFGTDKTRFFFKKRGVEDKYFGPFIKTIMTRCIHCTRCVRFANDICNIDHLGTLGRGNQTEIHFYYPTILFSEFSGNLIDLCPVGALTSKPFAFQARFWELTKKEAVDILDAIGSNIQVHIFNNKIVRIVPKTNIEINKEWISNTTRFFFDSLKYQRIQYPMIKTGNFTFSKISWYKAFTLLHRQITCRDAFQIKSIIGNLIDIESLFLLKKILNKIGITNVQYETYQSTPIFSFSSDYTANFLFTKNLQSIQENDACLIINSDIRKEASILNLHLLNRFKKGNFHISYIGKHTNYTYPAQHIGTSLKTFYQILIGKHTFCKILKKANNPCILIGENIFLQKNGIQFLNKWKSIKILKQLNIHFLNTQTSFINFLDVNFLNTKHQSTSNSTLYLLYNTHLETKLQNKADDFIVYQGHHFTEDAQSANLILPGLSFLEKEGTYINIEGIIQKNVTNLNLKTNQKKDGQIWKYFYEFIVNKNQKIKQKNINFLSMTFLMPYLLKKTLMISHPNYLRNQKLMIYFNTLQSFFKNYFYTNILEKYSKLLIHSKKLDVQNHQTFKK